MVRTGGYASQTIRDRLNAVPGVAVNVSKGVVYFNGKPWTDHEQWTAVPEAASEP